MDIRSTLFCSLLAAGAVAHAEGLYVLGSVGQSNIDMKDTSRSDLDNWYGPALASSKFDDSDTAYKLQLGYQFNENFALEAGYMDLGQLEYSATLNDSSQITTDAASKGWNIDGVLVLPVNAGVSMLGKFGVMRVETEYSETGLKSETETKTAPILGIGVAWNFWQSVSARAEWEHIFDFGSNDNNLDADLFSIGLSYNF